MKSNLQTLVNQINETLKQTTSHVEFLAVRCNPELKPNLQAIAETLHTVQDVLDETQQLLYENK